MIRFLCKVLVCAAAAVSFATTGIAQASLPTSFSGPGWTSSLPAGWAQYGMGSDYTTTYDASGNAGKFDGTNDSLVINFSSAPGTLSYYLQGNGFSGGTFTVLESANGTAYTNVAAYTTLTSSAQQFSNALLSSSRYVKFVYTLKSSGNIGIDGVSITAAACSAPATQASAIGAANATTSGINLSWTAGNGSGTMIVLRPTAQPGVAPSNGTAYTANTAWTSAGQINSNNRVVFRAAGTSVTGISGLTAGTGYTATAYEYSATDCYNTTAAPAVAFYTLSTEPAAHAASFTATAAAYNQVNLSFSAASTISNAAGYIVLQKTGSAPTGLPADGQAYTAGATIGDATVAAVITGSSATSQSIGGLTGNTDYYYTLVPYNWNGSNASTYNYYTAATIPGTMVHTPVSPGVTSDIIDNAGAGFYTGNINYTLWQSAVITSIGTGAGAGLGVFGMLLRDGGAAAPDVDAIPTTLTALTIGYTGTANTIRSAAIFDGTTKIADGTVSANSISFSGLSVSAPDDGTKAFTLAVTFNTTVTDNDKLVFTITSATAASNTVSSQFAAANAGGATSENNNGNDNNRVEVDAAKLVFVQQPTNTGINAVMSPAVTVAATDASGNRDLDYTAVVSVSSTGTLTGAPVSVNAVNGLATFSSLTHTAAGTGLILTASSGNFTPVNSNTFSIVNITFVNGDYRTTGSGTWVSNNAAPAIWERYNGTAWVTSNSPAYNTSSNVYVQNALTTGGNFANSVNLKIMSGGVFNCNHASTAAGIYIYDGGTLNMANTLTNAGTFEIEDNGTLNVNYGASGGSPIWNGTEIFHPLSNVNINQWDATATTPQVFTGSNISANMYNSYTAAFGNLAISLTADPGGNFVINAGGVNANLAHNNLRVVQTNASRVIQLSTTNNVTTGIGGNFIVENTFAGTFRGRTGLGTTTFNIKGNYTQNAGTVQLNSSTSNGTVVNFNIDGNMTLTGSAIINYHSGTVNAPNVITGNINLKGDLDAASGALISSGATGTGNTANIGFTGTGDGLTPATTQTCSIASAGTSRNQKIDFTAASGAYVQLAGQDLELGNNGSFSAANGATLDFGFNGATALNIKSVSGATTGFTAASGATLKITSPAGITSSGSTGNVQTTSRNFDQGGNYMLAGNTSQVSGNGTPATVAGLTVNNAFGIALSQPTTVTGTFTLANGIISTAANALTVNAGAGISGGSSASFVNGPLIVKTNSTATIPLPVGKGTAYGPAAVTPVSATASTYTAEYFNDANATPDHSNFGTSNLVKVDTFQYWDISRTAGAAASVTLSWGAASNVTFGGDLTVAHYNGTAWENAGRTAATGSTAAGTVTSSPVSSFSPFTIGFTRATPLAIKLSSFNAAKKQHSVALSWSTAEELASDRFALERSENGRDYTVLATVQASGHAAVYNYTDEKPAQGKNYYRLALTAANGNKQYSNVRMVDMGNDNAFTVTAFPNPVADKLILQAAGKTTAATVQLTDLTGKVLVQVQMTGDAVTIDMTQVAAGIYLVRYADGTHTELFKIVK